MTRLVLVVLVGLSMVPAANALAGQTAPAALIAPEGSATIVFADAGGTRKAVVAVKPTSARLKPGEEAAVIEFSLGELRNPAPGEPLRVKWRRAKEPADAPEALEFELDDTVRRPGVYTVHIAPLPLSNPSERLRIQIDIKPAKLVLPPKLVVARTLNLLFRPTTLPPRLEVRESDRATRVPMLAVSRATAFAGTLPIAVGLTPDPTPIALEAGQSAQVTYTVDDDVPVGTVTGALRFSATEIAEPVSLDYEVRTRLTSWFIPLVIGLGFFVGWLVRKRLVDIAQLGEAREKAKALLVKVDKPLSEIPDKAFHDPVKKLRDDLDTARHGKNTAAVSDAITKLDEGWRSALAEFNAKKALAAGKLAELKSLAGPPLPLPPVADTRLAAAREAAARVELALSLNDVTEAEAELTRQETLARDIWRMALAWQEKIGAFVRLLQTTPVGFPAPVQTQFAERATTVALDLIKPGDALDTHALQRALFIDFHTEARDARVLLNELSTRLGFEWNLIAKAVEPIRPKLQPEYDALSSAFAAFQRDLAHAADGPAPFADTLDKRLQELDAHWRATLFAKASPTTPRDRRTALKALDEGKQYLQLANALVVEVGVLLGGEVASRVSIVPWLTTAMERLQPVGFEAPPMGQATPPDPVEPLTPGEARFLQSVLLALIYIAAYWMLNADTFGNSTSDLAMLFVTSFGLDLSVEGILSLKK